MARRAQFLIRWSVASGGGMALGFLAFLEVLFLLSFGLDFDLHWSMEAVQAQEDPMSSLRLGLPIGLLLAGTIVTSCQAIVLRGVMSRGAAVWIFTGPLGFGFVLILVWPLAELGIWGNIPGPVEPFGIVGGGLLMMASMQWLLLRRAGISATRPLLFWIAGIPLGMVVSIVILLVWMEAFQTGVPWAAEIAVYGLMVGGMAALVSGRALYDAIMQSRSSLPVGSR